MAPRRVTPMGGGISLLKNLLKNWLRYAIYTSVAENTSEKIEKNLSPNDKVFIYSYWFGLHAFFSLHLLKHHAHVAKRICRAHGFDIFERLGIIPPFRLYALSQLDAVFSVSQFGTEYLQHRYPQWCRKVTTSYLGTADHGIQKYCPSDALRIVSCSRVTAVKRLDRIVSALEKVSWDRKIEWTHYGDGAGMIELKDSVAQFTHTNVTIRLVGNIANAELMHKYQAECYDLFVNTSDSEGIPVSIMEAMSFGIPCFGTDVGGNREIIEHGKNGFLVTTNECVGALSQLMNSDSISTTLATMRTSARVTWEKHYHAEKNYQQFLDELM